MRWRGVSEFARILFFLASWFHSVCEGIGDISSPAHRRICGVRRPILAGYRKSGVNGKTSGILYQRVSAYWKTTFDN